MASRCSSLCLTLLTLVSSWAAATAIAQQQQEYRNVEPTSFTSNHNGQPETVTFGQHTPAVGDQVEQTISVEMRLATSLRRGNELVEKKSTMMRNEQRRTVTTTEVADARTTAVLVRYDRATTQSLKAAENEAASPGDSQIAAPPSGPIGQPVQGKSYHCHREPGEQGRLVITDTAGSIPPMNEYEIVARNMETVGRPNPFVNFLTGRSLRVGETIALPKEVAHRLFGMGNEFGEVLRFDLTLEDVQAENGTRCAVFHALVDAASNDSSQMRLQVEGPLVVEIDSCRAVRTELAGPIGMSETRGSYSTAQQLIGTGKLAMTITSECRGVRR